MRRLGRTFVAMLIATVSAAAMFKGFEIVSFGIADWRMERSEARREAIRSWASVSGLATAAYEILLSGRGDDHRINDLANALSTAPLSSEHWLMLARARLIAGEAPDKVIAAFADSGLTGANEGEILAQRATLGVSLWEVLPAAQHRRVIADLASVLHVASDSERSVLHRAISDKTEGVRNEIHAALIKSGRIDVKALAVIGLSRPEDRRPARTAAPTMRSHPTPQWLGAAWSARREITISNKDQSEAISSYQTKIEVKYDPEMKPDFADIRFTDQSGVNLISYWLEDKTDRTAATFWVRIPFVAPAGSATVYMYYGNAAGSSLSDGEETFLWFDDFRDPLTANWSVVNDASKSEITTGGSLRIHAFAPQTMAYLASKTPFRPPLILGARLSVSGSFPGLWMADLAGNPPLEAANMFGLMPHPNGDAKLLYGRQRRFGAQSNRAYRAPGNVQDAQSYELKWNSEGVEYRQNGQLLGRNTIEVPQTELYFMIGGGTFNAASFMMDVAYVYLRGYAAADPVVTFGEVEAYPSPELGAGKASRNRAAPLATVDHRRQ